MIGLLSTVGATYAWFTLSYSNAKQSALTSSVSEGDIVLSVGESLEGEFSRTCNLKRLDTCDTLIPVSTSDAQRYYSAVAQNRDGKMFLYKEEKEHLLEKIIYAEIYLKAKYKDGDIFFDTDKLSINGDAQFLAGSRLGMKFSDGNYEKSYIFDLEAFAKGALVERSTIEAEPHKVVSYVDENGNATFQNEVVSEFETYSKRLEEENGASPLFEIRQDSPVKVEIWLYMEGCDPHCINEAQKSNFDFNIAFVAEPKEE